MYNPDRMDTEFPLVREAHDLPKATLRDRNDEILERIYIGRRFKNDTVRVALRSKMPRKTVCIVYKDDQSASAPKSSSRKTKGGQ